MILISLKLVRVYRTAAMKRNDPSGVDSAYRPSAVYVRIDATSGLQLFPRILCVFVPDAVLFHFIVDYFPSLMVYIDNQNHF